MADDRRTIETPRGEARFISLGQEEVIKGKPTGKQSGGIIFKGENLEKITAEIESFIEDTFPAKRAKSVTRPFKTDKEGNVYLQAKCFYKRKDGSLVEVPIFDRNGKPVKNPPKIGNGSTVRFKVCLRPTEFGGKDFVGVTLYAIKLLKLVEFSGGGFSSEDDDEDDDGGFDADSYTSSGSDEGGEDRAGSPGADYDDEIPF